MAKSEEAVRNYSGSDADMIQASRLTHGFFSTDKVLFSGFDSDFADPFADNWLQSIEHANNTMQDTVMLNQQTEMTSIVEKKLDESKKFFQSMKYFIEKAFPGKKEVWAQFGYNDYETARRGETKMIQFLGVLYKTASNYKDKLIEAGFDEEKIDRIKTLRAELTEANYNQEIAKKGRPAVTQERIIALNGCYSFMQKVSKAAKIIFADNYAKYQQYLLPTEKSEKKEETPEVNPN